MKGADSTQSFIPEGTEIIESSIKTMKYIKSRRAQLDRLPNCVYKETAIQELDLLESNFQPLHLQVQELRSEYETLQATLTLTQKELDQTKQRHSEMESLSEMEEYENPTIPKGQKVVLIVFLLIITFKVGMIVGGIP